MLLADLVAVSDSVAATPARSQKIRLIGNALRAAGADEVEIATAYLSGELRQRRTGVGWATLRDLPAPSPLPRLTLAEVDETFDRIAADSGAGTTARRATQLGALFGAATDRERHFFGAWSRGELRQGALDGVMVEAIANAADVPLADVRRAFMLRGALPPIATVALRDGVESLRAVALEVGRPILPMLAQSAPDVSTALAQQRSRGRWPSNGSSTGFGYRCTGTGPTCTCSRAPLTTSRPGTRACRGGARPRRPRGGSRR